jgi:hypothetical protein
MNTTEWPARTLVKSGIAPAAFCRPNRTGEHDVLLARQTLQREHLLESAPIELV